MHNSLGGAVYSRGVELVAAVESLVVVCVDDADAVSPTKKETADSMAQISCVILVNVCVLRSKRCVYTISLWFSLGCTPYVTRLITWITGVWRLWSAALLVCLYAAHTTT